MPSIRPFAALCALSLCAIVAPAQSSAAPAVSNLVAFSVSNPIGNVLQGEDGAIYGVTAPGTTIAGGLLYRAAADGTGVSTLFQIDSEQAVQPQAGLTLGSDGMFYGTTGYGSRNESSTTGTVFRISASGTGFEVIHRFATATSTNAEFAAINTDGAFPEAEMIEGSDGYLYGVTSAGGPNGTGAIFKVSHDGADFKVLHTFAADTDTTTAGLVVTVDGAAPKGPLVEGADGFFYGTASRGGANGRGTVFRVAADGSVFEVLHVFSATTADATTGQLENADGAAPVAGLIDGGDGTFYGVTSVGGADGLGVLFAISPDGGTFTVLHQFTGADGARPVAELLLGSDGKLYGTTSAGGTNSSGTASTLGTIFSIDRDGTNFSSLHSFDGTIGSAPSSRLVEVGNAEFIGLLASGGKCGYGTLFRYSGAGTTYTGDERCGRKKSNNNSGGGSGGPALVLLLGSLAWLRRKVV
jgi:uncharacterized repeat protein (TIGR03803 family)